MYFITDKIILLYHHYGYNNGSHWLIFWCEPHPNYDLRTGVEGGSNLWISWVGSVDIEWKYYKRNSLQISNLQSFQLPSIGNDILSCKIKSKGSGWIKGFVFKAKCNHCSVVYLIHERICLRSCILR